MVWLALLLIGWLCGAPLIVSFFGSLAFGATAIASVSSAPILLSLAALAPLAASQLLSRTFFSDLSFVLRTQWLSQLVAFATFYIVITAFVLPRLFAGTVDTVVPVGGTLVILPLAPVSGNLNQTIYLLGDAILFFTIALRLHRGAVNSIGIGLIVWSTLMAGTGLLDVVLKLAGLGDAFAAIRTASYAMLTDYDIGGFFRVVGGFPEASAYAINALQALAFSFVYWRNTGSHLCCVVSLVLLFLIVVSTSSTAYAGLAVLIGIYGGGLAVRMLHDRIYQKDLIIVFLAFLAIVAALSVHLYNESLTEPFQKMILSATIEKGTSDSAIERGLWNSLSIRAFLDTYGLGIGVGSTRSSSWLISVVAQLGILGATFFAIAIAYFAKALSSKQSGSIGELTPAASAAAIAGLIASSVGGGNADPGPIFYVALALISSSQKTQSVDERNAITQPGSS
jgi:hypothetical protein